MNWVGRITAVYLLALSLGLHWVVLQSAAWSSMLIRYSEEGTFTQAVGKTFDGKHPCALCKAIQKERTEQQKRQHQPQLNPELKLELAVPWTPLEFDFSSERELVSAANSQSALRQEPPPKPHPRLPREELV